VVWWVIWWRDKNLVADFADETTAWWVISQRILRRVR